MEGLQTLISCVDGAALNRLAGRYDNPMAKSTISPSQCLRIWPMVSSREKAWVYCNNDLDRIDADWF
jgi:hypothetical protein